MKRLLCLFALTSAACFAQGRTVVERCATAVPRSITVTASTGSIQVVPAGNRTPTVVCSISFNADTAGNIKLVTGTGTNCATGAANLTGLYPNATGLALGPFMVPADVALCINFSATVTAGGMVTVAYP